MELPPDFTLRSGLGGPAPPDPQVVLAMQATLCVFCEAATRDAALYAEAAGRSVVTARDVAMGLKAQAVPSAAFWERPALVHEFAEHREGLLDDMRREQEHEEEEQEHEEEEVAWTRAPDGTAIADRLHAAEAEFDEWNPTDQVELAVRRAICRAGGEEE